MKHAKLEFSEEFKVLFDVRQVQAAVMVIAPGDQEGGPDNRHRGADQWLYVVAGQGVAIVEGVEKRLAAGDLLVIEQGERHEIRNPADEPLQALTWYHPPAYDAHGERLPAGEK
ncbi:MAG TPA: cupin domain-containing protein [Stenotrophomonas sp.]|jgi:mannose-6-phosphate isomerase-like protein (cupin superfamily)